MTRGERVDLELALYDLRRRIVSVRIDVQARRESVSRDAHPLTWEHLDRVLVWLRSAQTEIDQGIERLIEPAGAL